MTTSVKGTKILPHANRRAQLGMINVLIWLDADDNSTLEKMIYDAKKTGIRVTKQQIMTSLVKDHLKEVKIVA